MSPTPTSPAYTLITSTLGPVLIAATARGVCRVTLDDAADALVADLTARYPTARRVDDDGVLGQAAAAVRAALDGAASSAAYALPLDLEGTPFQQRVWQALRAIPRGETRTYAAVARAIGAPRAVRAVGTACGANPVAILVPCHRVVRADGGLGGYRWGLSRKQQLLRAEQAP